MIKMAETTDVMSIVDLVEKEIDMKLKRKQKEVLEAFMKGNDVFCCLSTGYGKSLCYALLPKLFDKMRNRPGSSIVVVISPLVALMIDQHIKFTNFGITSDFICEALDTVKGIHDGGSQLIFISPESLLNNVQWRNVLLSEIFQNNLVCVAIDEAHCVPKWYVDSYAS